MAFIIKSPIEVYKVRGNDLHLLARLPTETYGTREPVRIAYTMDTNVVHAVMLGDTAVMLGDTAVMLGDTAVMLGDTAVMLGDTAVMLGDTADDDIKNLPLAYVIDPCGQSSSLSSDEAATSQSAIQTSSDPEASMELTCDVDTGADSEISQQEQLKSYLYQMLERHPSNQKKVKFRKRSFRKTNTLYRGFQAA